MALTFFVFHKDIEYQIYARYIVILATVMLS